MIRTLPVFKGYTVDARLRQFRKINVDGGIVFIEFESDWGDVLLTEYILTLDTDSKEFNEIANAVL